MDLTRLLVTALAAVTATCSLPAHAGDRTRIVTGTRDFSMNVDPTVVLPHPRRLVASDRHAGPEAVVQRQGQVVDVQQWTRAVTLVADD